MPYDRPRQQGEDPISWALATGRADEATATRWRNRIAEAGEGAASAIEYVIDVLAPGSAVALTASGTPAIPATAAATSAAAGARRPAGTDPRYALNPVLDEIAASQAKVYATALQHNPQPPTLFESGDLPPFTASGIDPSALAEVPWQARHHIAAEPNRAEVLAMIEEVSGEDGPAMAQMLFGNNQVNKQYQARVMAWATNGAIAADRQREVAARVRNQRAAASAGAPVAKSVDEMTDDEIEAAVFGEMDQAAAQRTADYEKAIAEGRVVGHFRR